MRLIIVLLFVGACATVPHYPVTVDYSQSLEQMIRSSNCEPIGQVMSDRNLSVRGRGETSANVVLFSLATPVTAQEVFQYLDNHHLRPALVSQLLAFTAEYPRVVWEKDIIALGSVTFKRGLSFHPHLSDRQGRCSLTLSDDEVFEAHSYFLAEK